MREKTKGKKKKNKRKTKYQKRKLENKSDSPISMFSNAALGECGLVLFSA